MLARHAVPVWSGWQAERILAWRLDGIALSSRIVSKQLSLVGSIVPILPETKKRMSDIIREERDGENAYISEIPAARRPG